MSNSTYLAGKMLLAMPGMGDPRFQKAVIFLCTHDAQGAMGLVINNPLHHMSMEELFKQLKFAPGSNAPLDMQIMSGGPVETQRGFLLHPRDFQTSDTIIVNHYGVSSTLDAMRDVAAGSAPRQMIFALGYAGWGAGQLEQEIQDNAWLVIDADDDLLFNTGAEAMWEKAFGRVGVKSLGLLSHVAGTA